MEGTLKIDYDMVRTAESLKNTHISTKTNIPTYLLTELYEKTFLCIQSKKKFDSPLEKS